MKLKMVVHCKIDPYDVYIGRPSKWGNPFSHLPGKGEVIVSSREEAVRMYEAFIMSQPDMIEEAKRELRGKILGCWCKTKKEPDRACHGDVLYRIANEICECSSSMG